MPPYNVVHVTLVLDIDIKLHPEVLPLLSPFGVSLTPQVQLAPIEGIGRNVDDSRVVWDCPFNT